MAVIVENVYGFCGVDLKCELTSFECIDSDEKIRYTTYGIRVSDSLDDIVFERTDVSTDRRFVEEFVRLCETRYISSLHLADVLEDYLP